MAKYRKQSGISLTEILVVISVMAILMSISIPAAKQLVASFESSTGVRQLINAALSNARAIAVREQTYAGVRFQEDLEGNTYMIFIQHDPSYDPTNAPQPLGTGLANGFRAVTGRKPMKLPEDVGLLNNLPYSDADLDDAVKLNDAKTFSIVFSPQGKLTIHLVRVRNKDGKTDNTSNDTIFNVQALVEPPNESAMFYQDDYPNVFIPANPDLGLDEEDSVQSFYIYSKSELNSIPVNFRWRDYFSTLDPEYISPYTGELVMEYREQSS